MTDSPTIARVDGSVGALARLKLTEPVRLYLYPVLVVLVLALNVAGIAAGAWPSFAAASVALALGLGAGTEAARASVYSPRAAVQAAMRARQQ